MTIICLCVPPDTITSGWRNGVWNDHNLSSPTSRLTVPEWQRAHNDHNLSLRVYHSTCEIWMTRGAGFVSARLSLDLWNLNEKGRRICLCAFTTRLAKPEWQRAQKTLVSARWSLNLLLLNDKGHKICLCTFITQLATFEWQRAQKTLLVSARLSLIECVDDRNWSPHVIGPTASGWQKAQKTTLVSACYHALSLRDSKRKLKSAGPNGSRMSSGPPPLDDKRHRRRC